MDQAELLTANEVADQLQVQPETVRRWRRRGIIPAVRLSPKVIRYQIAAVIEALTTRQRGTDGEIDGTLQPSGTTETVGS